MLSSFKNFLFYIKISYQVKSLIKGLRAKFEKKESTNMNILFCPFNSNILNMSRESVVAARCEQEGAKISFLQYDLLTEMNDYLPNKPKLHLKIYYRVGRFFYRTNKIKTIRYSSYNAFKNIDAIKRQLDQMPIEEIADYKYHESKVGEYSISSAIRAELSTGPLWEDESFVKLVKSFMLTSCIIADGFIQILEKNKFDKIVMSHAIYGSWGVLFDIARSQGINVDVYNSSYRMNTLRFYKNTPNAPFPEAEWPRFKNVELNKDEDEILDDYIKSREDQSQDNISLFQGEYEYPEVNAFIKKAKDNGGKLTAMFTNISWDAYSFSKDAVFPSMIDWLVETIEYAKKNKNLYLIVKAHPAEIFHKVPDKFRVKTFMPKKLPGNIFFVKETIQVKPFDLYPHLDFGIINISTVCIEMALEKIPVLTSGANGHYSNIGFTIDPTSKKEYFDALDSLVNGTSEFRPDIKMARRYMYYRFFREAIPFRFIQIQNGNLRLDNNFSLNDSESLEGINVIADGILRNEPFVYN